MEIFIIIMIQLIIIAMAVLPTMADLNSNSTCKATWGSQDQILLTTNYGERLQINRSSVFLPPFPYCNLEMEALDDADAENYKSVFKRTANYTYDILATAQVGLYKFKVNLRDSQNEEKFALSRELHVRVDCSFITQKVVNVDTSRKIVYTHNNTRSYSVISFGGTKEATNELTVNFTFAELFENQHLITSHALKGAAIAMVNVDYTSRKISFTLTESMNNFYFTPSQDNHQCDTTSRTIHINSYWCPQQIRDEVQLKQEGYVVNGYRTSISAINEGLDSHCFSVNGMTIVKNANQNSFSCISVKREGYIVYNSCSNHISISAHSNQLIVDLKHPQTYGYNGLIKFNVTYKLKKGTYQVVDDWQYRLRTIEYSLCIYPLINSGSSMIEQKVITREITADTSEEDKWNIKLEGVPENYRELYYVYKDTTVYRNQFPTVDSTFISESGIRGFNSQTNTVTIDYKEEHTKVSQSGQPWLHFYFMRSQEECSAVIFKVEATYKCSQFQVKQNDVLYQLERKVGQFYTVKVSSLISTEKGDCQVTYSLSDTSQGDKIKGTSQESMIKIKLDNVRTQDMQLFGSRDGQTLSSRFKIEIRDCQWLIRTSIGSRLIDIEGEDFPRIEENGKTFMVYDLSTILFQENSRSYCQISQYLSVSHIKEREIKLTSDLPPNKKLLIEWKPTYSHFEFEIRVTATGSKNSVVEDAIQVIYSNCNYTNLILRNESLSLVYLQIQPTSSLSKEVVVPPSEYLQWFSSSPVLNTKVEKNCIEYDLLQNDCVAPHSDDTKLKFTSSNGIIQSNLTVPRTTEFGRHNFCMQVKAFRGPRLFINGTSAVCSYQESRTIEIDSLLEVAGSNPRTIFRGEFDRWFQFPDDRICQVDLNYSLDLPTKFKRLAELEPDQSLMKINPKNVEYVYENTEVETQMIASTFENKLTRRVRFKIMILGQELQDGIENLSKESQSRLIFEVSQNSSLRKANQTKYFQLGRDLLADNVLDGLRFECTFSDGKVDFERINGNLKMTVVSSKLTDEQVQNGVFFDLYVYYKVKLQFTYNIKLSFTEPLEQDESNQEEVETKNETAKDVKPKQVTSNFTFNFTEAFEKQNKKEEKKVQQTKIFEKPKIKLGKFNYNLTAKLEFNQPLVFDESQIQGMFEVSIKSLSDLSERSSYNQTSSAKRVLYARSQEEEELLANDFGFSWHLEEIDPMYIILRFLFDNPEKISAESQDLLKVKLLDGDFLKNEESGFSVDLIDMKSPACGNEKGTICRLMPPLIDEETAQAITDNSETARASISSFIAGNFLLVVFVGGSLQQLWGVIRSMQYAILLVFIKVGYPGVSYLFLLLMADISNLDIFQGEDLHSETFEFKETMPLNPHFETFGLDNQNFLTTSGSITLFVLFMMIESFLFYLLHKLAKSLFRFSACRKIGIRIQKNSFKSQITVFSIEGYLDIAFSCLLNLNAFLSVKDFWEFTEFFIGLGNLYASLVTILALVMIILLPIRIFKAIHANFDDKVALKKKYHILTAGLNIKNFNSAIYNTVFMLVRLISVITIITLNKVPSIQIQLFIYLNLFALAFLENSWPYKDNSQNRIEMFNQFMILMLTYTIAVIMNVSIPQDIRAQVGLFMVFLIMFNIASNLIFVTATKLWYLIKETRRSYKIKVSEHRLMKEMRKKKLLTQAVPGYEVEIENEVAEHEAKQFCQNWSVERKWLEKNNLRFHNLDQELQYQIFLKKFNFVQRKKNEEVKLIVMKSIRKNTLKQLSLNRLSRVQSQMMEKYQVENIEKKTNLNVIREEEEVEADETPKDEKSSSSSSSSSESESSEFEEHSESDQMKVKDRTADIRKSKTQLEEIVDEDIDFSCSSSDSEGLGKIKEFAFVQISKEHKTYTSKDLRQQRNLRRIENESLKELANPPRIRAIYGNDGIVGLCNSRPYILSILHCLIGIEFVSGHFIQSKCKSRLKGKLLLWLVDLFKDAYSIDKKGAEDKQHTLVVEKIKINHRENEDPFQFFKSLLSNVERSCRSGPPFKDKDDLWREQDSIICYAFSDYMERMHLVRAFSNLNEQSVQCRLCKSKQYVFQHTYGIESLYYDFEKEKPGTKYNLKDLVDEHFGPRCRFQKDAHPNIYCEPCQVFLRKSDQIIKTTMLVPAKIQMIQLKRFKEKKGQKRLIKEVEIPLELDLQRHIKISQLGLTFQEKKERGITFISENMYDLKAVICQREDQLLTFIKRDTHCENIPQPTLLQSLFKSRGERFRWFEFTEGLYRQVSVESVLKMASSYGYIIIYEQR